MISVFKGGKCSGDKGKEEGDWRQEGGKMSKVNSKDREDLAEGVAFNPARKGQPDSLNGAVNILGVFKGEDF